MNKSITQDMAYRQSLMKYAEKYGVSRASRKYNKSRSYNLLLEAALGWKCGIPCLSVQAAKSSADIARTGNASISPNEFTAQFV